MIYKYILQEHKNNFMNDPTSCKWTMLEMAECSYRSLYGKESRCVMAVYELLLTAMETYKLLRQPILALVKVYN